MSSKSFAVVTIGNAMIDMYMVVKENNTFSRIDSAEQLLCFRFGEKIHVDSCRFLLGGNACNAAVGLSRLGQNTAFCAEIGSDEFAKKIREGLQKENIDLSCLKETPNALSSLAVSITYQGERTLFVDHVKREHDFSFDGIAAKWIYLTSLGLEWKRAYANVLAFVERENTHLAFSPGTHQFEEEGLLTIKNVLRQSKILFVNKEEAERITGIKGRSDEIKQLLIELQKMGAKVVSITDGNNGSYGIDENEQMFSLKTFPCAMVEKTGAGDAYASGFLSAIMSQQNAAEAMRWGAVNSASVIEHIGAQEGLLTKEKIQKRLESHKAFQAQII